MENEITASSDATITITLMHIETGCIYDLHYEISTIGEDISIPNVFSPVNEDNNDDRSPILPGGYIIIEGYIYDRWVIKWQYLKMAMILHGMDDVLVVLLCKGYIFIPLKQLIYHLLLKFIKEM